MIEFQNQTYWWKQLERLQNALVEKRDNNSIEKINSKQDRKAKEIKKGIVETIRNEKGDPGPGEK